MAQKYTNIQDIKNIWNDDTCTDWRSHAMATKLETKAFMYHFVGIH